MNTPDLREWLLTNGLGSFASGTISDARTRTYHGWLVAALHPPDQRTLLLSHLEASLEIAGQVFALGTNFWTDDKIDPWGYQFLQSFQSNPIPTWIWGTEEWQLSRQLTMPDGREDMGYGASSISEETDHASSVIDPSLLPEDKGQGIKDTAESKIQNSTSKMFQRILGLKATTDYRRSRFSSHSETILPAFVFSDSWDTPSILAGVS